ncbi:MAG: glycerol-3-phosphate dehydrogenase, partial [Polaromonas sp.]|nr:glycerol-3-phosphate dehydrogenase [Gemmatimonadaceae bacterium]
MTRCAVIGAGAWGTALADVLARNRHEVVLWALEEDVVATINTSRVNTRFLDGITLAPTLHATSSIAEALAGAS